MTVEELAEKLNDLEDEYGQFERIPAPRHPRPDICAFLMLADLVPGEGEMLDAAHNDQIYLSVDCGELARVITDEDILTLARCGVSYDDEAGSLVMCV